MKMHEFNHIIFHADDFAACPEASQHILDCKEHGTLDSISVLTNSPLFDECMPILKTYSNSLKYNIHFNIAEGPCLSTPSDVSLLVDERGMFCISFFKTLLMSCGKKGLILKQQLETEFTKQLNLLLPYVDSIRIDSHQHYHMIPVVLDAILSVVQKSGKEIEFIRIPAEPISPFLKHPSLYFSYQPINLIKNIVLNVLNWYDTARLKPFRTKTAVFFGIVMSGHMDLKRVMKLLPNFCKIANKKNLPLEILAHPGGVSNVASLMDSQNADCRAFYMNSGRLVEKEMFLRIREFAEN